MAKKKDKKKKTGKKKDLKEKVSKKKKQKSAEIADETIVKKDQKKKSKKKKEKADKKDKIKADKKKQEEKKKEAKKNKKRDEVIVAPPPAPLPVSRRASREKNTAPDAAFSRPEPVVKAFSDHSSHYNVTEAVKVLKTLQSLSEIDAFTKGEKRLTITRIIPTVKKQLS